jgi:hypothetical protein
MLKIYKAMTLLEEYKYLEPNMSKALHSMCKSFYLEYKNLKSEDGSKFQDNISLNESDISFVNNSVLEPNGKVVKSDLPTIAENEGNQQPKIDIEPIACPPENSRATTEHR